MRISVKFSLLIMTVFAFASCQKTEFSSVSPSAASVSPSNKVMHDGFTPDNDGSLFTDKDKCKKCHTSSRLAAIVWNAPYMSDNRYNSIEELIDNFDFINNVHLSKGEAQSKEKGISDQEKEQLISYLKNLEAAASTQVK